MNTYLTIMVTVLVVTQVIRIAQNTIQLHRQNKLIKKEIAHIDWDDDIDINYTNSTTGQWEKYFDDGEQRILCDKGKGVCPNCHRIDSIDPLARYCRYCGAKLKGEM